MVHFNIARQSDLADVVGSERYLAAVMAPDFGSLLCVCVCMAGAACRLGLLRSQPRCFSKNKTHVRILVPAPPAEATVVVCVTRGNEPASQRTSGP